MNVQNRIQNLTTRLPHVDEAFEQRYQARVEQDLKTPVSELLETSLPKQFTFPDGARVDLPLADDSSFPNLQGISSSLNTEEQAAFDNAAEALLDALEQEYQANPDVVNGAPPSDQVKEAMDIQGGVLVSATSKANGGHDNREATLMSSAIEHLDRGLYGFTKGIQDRMEFNSSMRTDWQELKDAVSDWPNDGSRQEFSWTEVRVDENGNTVVEKYEDVPLTKEEATALMEKLEGLRSSLSDILQMDRLMLQDQFQRNEQIRSVLSAIMKDNHSTRQAISSNMRSA